MPPRPIPRSKAPRVGRPTGRFTQHRRLDLLREKLETHTAGLTLEELAGMLRITTRSVRRYLRELALVTELESIAVRPGGVHLWRIKPSERGRTVALRRTQAYALLAARRVFDVLRGSALFDEIDVALRDIEQVARRPAIRSSVRGEAPNDVRLEDRFAFLPPPARGYSHQTEALDEVFRAVAELRVLRFLYREDGSSGSEPKESTEMRGGARVTAHPYALLMHGGAVACIAHDSAARASRAFALDRMTDVVASETERYELPAEFAITDWVHGDFGVARAPTTFKLLIEFDPRVADAVRTRRVHPSQKVAVSGDGRVRASLAVPSCPEVMDRVRSWLLGFGAAARVLEPRELADEIARELRRAVSRYD
jgi:predicted DNA-binding transcriptional regulator YafY